MAHPFGRPPVARYEGVFCAKYCKKLQKNLHTIKNYSTFVEH